nr:MAG: minor capsid protein 2 [Bacteriophage sp.]
MNNVEKTITKAQLKLEQRALKELKKSYEKAKHDIEIQISALNSRKDMQNLQSIIYQKKYQEILLKQIEGVIDDLNKGQYETLQDFFEGSYSTGYIGSMYDLHNQGIPLVIPIDPKKMVTAVMTDSKLSKNYYQSRILPENLSTLKRNVRQELTRGIASGKTWIEVAYQVAQNMNSPFNRAMRDAMSIIRTEGHRINQQGFLDASHEAKDKGADVVKQWDSTLDGNTRPAHRIADGQIKELDEPFIVDGEKMDAPSVGGSARNVCNCRCQLLQRARWALDEDELRTLQDRANFFGLDKSQDFDDFKQKYLNLPKNADTMKVKPSVGDWKSSTAGQTFKNKKEAFQYFKDLGIKMGDSRKYPMDEQIAIGMAQWHSKFSETYPEFTSKIIHKIPEIKNVAPSSLPYGVLGQFEYYLTGKVSGIKLNSYAHRNYDEALKSSMRSAERGWHSGGSAYHTIIHEYGHYVSHSMGELEKGFEHKIITATVKEYKKNHPEYTFDTYKGASDALSKYGTTSEAECFAECFGEYFGEDEPREFATIFGKILEKAMKGVQ